MMPDRRRPVSVGQQRQGDQQGEHDEGNTWEAVLLAGKEQLRVSRLAMDVAGSQTDFSQEPKFVEAKAGKILPSTLPQEALTTIT